MTVFDSLIHDCKFNKLKYMHLFKKLRNA